MWRVVPIVAIVGALCYLIGWRWTLACLLTLVLFGLLSGLADELR